MKTDFLGVIPARSGSKGVEQKNIREVNGKPLLEHTIEHAKNSEKLSDFLVSTDSEEFATLARECGAPVPFIRPAELATDTALTVDVLEHSIKTYEQTNDTTVAATVLLQPTVPCRLPADIDKAIQRFESFKDPTSLISCYNVTEEAHPNIMYKKKGEYFEPLNRSHPRRRQKFEPVYLRNGAIYIASRDLIIKEGKLYTDHPISYEMPRSRSINIDEPIDLRLAEVFFNDRNENLIDK